MALARVSSPIDGDPILASLYNGDFNNIHNNGQALIDPLTSDLNVNNKQLTALRLENLSTAPTAAVAGRIYHNTALQLVEYDGGTKTYGIGAQPSRVSGLVGTMSSQSGTFAADQYVMRSSDGKRSWIVTATSAFAASVGTAGPNAGGRDVAGVFSSTYIHWYAITTGALSTAPAGLVSSSPPTLGPVLPTNYVGWTYLGGSVYTSASTTVAAAHKFRGSRQLYDSQQLALNATVTTSETTVSVALIVPPNATVYRLSAPAVSVTSTGSADRAITYKVRSESSQDLFNNAFTAVGFNAAHSYSWSYGGMEMPNPGPFFALATVASTDLSGGAMALAVDGYSMPNGDV